MSAKAAGAHQDKVIGRRIPRLDSKRLMRGRGRYIGDIVLPRMLHLAFVRSPYAHARILSLDLEAARACANVAAVFSGAELAKICKPLIGVASNRQGHKSAPQFPMAIDRVHWQGQPVVAVVAASRAEAEDAVQQVVVEWQELPAMVDAETAVSGAAAIHASLGDNLAFAHTISTGDPDKAFAEAAIVVERQFVFERQTALTLEPRGLIADWDNGSETLTVHHSHQSPFQMQDVFSQHFGIPEHKVRVIAPDVGGGFGLKINVYAEELAVVAASRLLGRPVKFCADRLESFVSDAHVRDHRISARIAVAADGRITAMEIDDLSAVGAFGMPLRFNIAEGMMAITSCGAPYEVPNYRGRTRSVYVNKNLIGMYRGVGIPLGVAVTEVLTDLAATRLGIDPAAFKRLNYRRKSSMPCVTHGGIRLDGCSFDECLDRLLSAMNYDALRREQAELREAGIFRGIGIATFVEPSAYGPPYYGPTEARISVQDGCTIRLEPSGVFRCLTSITDQGQGTLTGLAQIIAETIGVPIENIEMISGDSATSPYGGGAWASRGMAIGGEAALKAANAMRENILTLAAAISQMSPSELDIVGGNVVSQHNGDLVMSLADVGRIGYFRQDTLPSDLNVELAVTRSHVANHQPYYTGNGVQGVYLEIDPETGFTSLLGLWAVDDCGRIINPLIVDEQVRGGIVQGIGGALYEECIYDDGGNLTNGTLADYLTPMAAEMPDIHVEHVETLERTTQLGAKGIGEAGTIGAIGVIWVGANDALKPLGAQLCHQPFTPERVLDAIRAARKSGQPN
jgi:carbon-monoxide dehydrogenase large subunit